MTFKQLASLLLLSSLIYSTAACSTVPIEEPKYTVIRSSDEIEIREYKSQLVAETTVTGNRKQAAGDGFRILADYIFGNNRASDKIAMTAPVSQSDKKQAISSAEKIAMTAPVSTAPASTESSDTEQNSHVVRFSMPEEYTIDTLPQPNNPAVIVRVISGRTMAAMKFSGYAREATVIKKKEKLREAVSDANLTLLGEIELAQYNPPWTPGPMRRNEVMVQVAK